MDLRITMTNTSPGPPRGGHLLPYCQRVHQCLKEMDASATMVAHVINRLNEPSMQASALNRPLVTLHGLLHNLNRSIRGLYFFKTKMDPTTNTATKATINRGRTGNLATYSIRSTPTAPMKASTNGPKRRGASFFIDQLQGHESW